MNFVFATALLLGQLGWGVNLPPDAVGHSPMVDGISPVTVSLMPEAEAVSPGQTLRVGVHFKLAPHWHIYWQNPGGAGFPTEINWQAPDATLSQLHWPAPQLFEETDAIVTYGYADETLLVAAARVHNDASQDIELAAEVKFLACNTICSPGTVHVRTTIPVRAAPMPPASDVAEIFAHFDAETSGGAPVEHDGRLWGQPIAQLARMLALALLGGIILNGMPCVLPILAMKSFGLVDKAGASAQTARRHALFYGVGVVGSMLLLASFVIVLRRWGHQVGWGFQFQNPGFVAALAAIMLLLALNCFGVFELVLDVSRVAAAQSRARGDLQSLLEGMLAVLVSTPCSAPALGTAVAFALAQPAWVVLAIFGSVGVGLALPWMALVCIPALRTRVPRPGPWMVYLKELFGFALLATCLWLSWVFCRLTDADGLARLMALLWLLALGAVGVGRVTARRPDRVFWGLAVLIAVEVGLASGGPLALLPVATQTALAASPMAYSESRLTAELEAKHAVLVDFTADWCITCKYNERHVLKAPAVIEALAAHHVTTLVADWTRRDPALLAELTRHGRVGVPMVLLYSPDAPQSPKLLPEVMTVGGLLEALKQLP